MSVEKTPGQLVSEAVAEIAKTLPPLPGDQRITHVSLMSELGNVIATIPLTPTHAISDLWLGVEFTVTMTVS